MPISPFLLRLGLFCGPILALSLLSALIGGLLGSGLGYLRSGRPGLKAAARMGLKIGAVIGVLEGFLVGTVLLLWAIIEPWPP